MYSTHSMVTDMKSSHYTQSVATFASRYPSNLGMGKGRSPTIANIVRAAIAKSRLESMGMINSENSQEQKPETDTAKSHKTGERPKKRLAWYVDSLIFNKTLQEVDEDQKTKYGSISAEKHGDDQGDLHNGTSAILHDNVNTQREISSNPGIEPTQRSNTEYKELNYEPGFNPTDFHTDYTSQYKSEDYTKYGFSKDTNYGNYSNN